MTAQDGRTPQGVAPWSVVGLADVASLFYASDGSVTSQPLGGEGERLSSVSAVACCAAARFNHTAR